MSSRPRTRTAFSLRFERDRTRELLRIVADRAGISMNRLAEDMIEQDLAVLALGLEMDLSHTLGLLADHRDHDGDAAWAAFAAGEALPEPLRIRRVTPDADPFGVAKAFAAER